MGLKSLWFRKCSALAPRSGRMEELMHVYLQKFLRCIIVPG